MPNQRKRGTHGADDHKRTVTRKPSLAGQSGVHCPIWGTESPLLTTYLEDGKVTLGASLSAAGAAGAGVVAGVDGAAAAGRPASARSIVARCAQMLCGLSVESCVT